MRLARLLALVSVALPAVPARAAFFPADTLDGPSADIVRVGDVAVARDGAGAVAYVKRDGAVDHVFAVRLAGGAWQLPERIDPGLDTASSQPVLAATDGGRLVAAFVSGGALYATTRVPAATGWSAPVQLAPTAADPALGLSVNGVAYVTYTAAGDVLAARLARDATTWEPMAQPLDITPSDASGDSHVAVSADGVALTTFVEGDKVVARKLFGTKVSQVPQVLNVDQVEGQPGGAADSPDVDAEDDSSFAWVVFRQSFADHPRVLARRLLGSTFDPPVVVDGEASGSGPRIDLSERGEGTTAVATAANGVTADMLHLDAFNTPQRLDTPPSVVAPAPVPTISETGSATVSWLAQPTAADAPAVHARHWLIDQTRRGYPSLEPDTLLSSAALGPVDPAAGLDASADRLGDVVTAFVQGSGDQRRLVAAEFDRPPGTFFVYTGKGYRSLKAKPLRWAAPTELWGSPTYTVIIDGRRVGTTTTPLFTPPRRVRDGTHHWWVLATDQRGQTARTASAPLLVDDTPPTLRVRIQRAGATVTVLALAHDTRSGLASIVTSFGDGTSRSGARATHRYRHGGTYKLVVRATDNAGAQRRLTRVIRVKR